MGMLEAALEYAGEGFAVFPLKVKDKIPATADGFKSATTDEHTIRRWWNQNPDFNIGIATGAVSGGLVVIDIDNGHGGDGSGSIRDWERANEQLPDTVTCLTGSGGVHYYYKFTEGYRNTAGLLDSVDIRADGGYVVAPPSVHPNGQLYEWEVEHSPEDIQIPRDAAPVKKLLHSRKKKTPEPKHQPVANAIQTGTRVDSLVQLIGSMKRSGVLDASIKQAVMSENLLRCDPPLTQEELAQEVFPALTRNWPAEDPYTAVSLPEPYVLSSVWEEPPKIAPPLIEDVLRQGHKMIISAPSKAGKSFALMELAFAIAEGMNWLGSKCRQGRVLYINMEIDDPSFINRFKAVYDGFGKGNDHHTNNITIWGLRGFSMPLAKLAPMIIRKAGTDYAAIIIDPLYKVMEGDENSNSDVALMVSQFDKIAKETGASVIYAHHFAKGTGGDRAAIDRGAGAGTFARDPDAILTMVPLDIADQVHPEHTAWRMEYVLREFPNKAPVNFWWRYPLHELSDALDDIQVETTATRVEKVRKKVQRAKTKEQIETTEKVVSQVCDAEGKFLLKDFIEAYKPYEILPNPTARRRLANAGYKSDGTAHSGKPAYWKKEE